MILIISDDHTESYKSTVINENACVIGSLFVLQLTDRAYVPDPTFYHYNTPMFTQ